MMRRWQVWPDQVIETRLGEIACVSEDAQVRAWLKAQTMMDVAGGTVQAVSSRAPTDLDGEMVTTKMVFEWKHDARVKPGPAQFEQPVTVTVQEPAPTATAEMVGPGMVEGLTAAQDAANAEADAERATRTVDTDGFDYSTLEDEDIEPAPEPAR